ncbi:MAG: GDP-mannose-dependent alpha-(1-6)-phosphatidylinositol monomannoside mannosyltransferase [Chroococcidiopsis sp. SAG 2025]|uniref:glycosyltransferase n=1 Tax=Chroococcidiopsis sp. SAG 2025 TaxID=171389 RepID=UPI002936EF1B|nr:glycosyltransferase [Chroococcidiopsis sp. SAG 2025]MDV2995702.1 GDP-mannose-dependent alpha-(1-6)-phosphatidylinositol monomannoside mannosyltransferase [Chroococcidiopsis sp. SAG 2025]
MPELAGRTNCHLWFPNIFEFKGGIQVYSAFLLNALESLYPNWHYQVYLKHDTRSPFDLARSPNTQFYYTGSLPLRLRTVGFAAQICGAGLWQRPSLAIATHLNFTVAAYWLKQLTGMPYWAIAHGVEAWDINRPTLQKALHHADRILAVSSYTRDRLLKEQNLDPAKVSLLPNTFDAERFKIQPKPQYLLERYGLTPEQLVILTVARLDCSERYKGYDQILQALPEIRRQIPSVRYLIVGKGSDRPRIEQLIAKLDLKDCVTLTGFIPDAELGDHYNLCDVFAMPSKGEGFGIVYLEALACGKPTLGGNRDGAIDALCHGELGALVDPDDTSAIARTLIQILQGTYSHPIIYRPEVLRQKVIDTFGFEQFKQTMNNLIQFNLGCP